MAIGRITGPLLSQNLLRNGIDLAFETDLLYLDVTNGRIGVKKSNPAYELDVNGTINANNLKVTYTGPGTGSAQIGKLVLSSGTIESTTGPITIQPGGNDTISLVGDTTVYGNLHATGNITADGDITIGNNGNVDNVIFNAEIKSDLIPATDNTYDLGSVDNAWASAYVDTVFANALAGAGNIQIDPKGGLLDVTSDIRVKGKNPIGTAPVVTNVLYVTMDGNDTNDGRAMDPSRACKTISGAVRSPYYRPGTLIRVSSGRYLENNPILMQPNTAIIGDDLRTCSIEPINKTQDLFHVQSGCYLAQMQFINGRSGLLPGAGYTPGTNRGAYATAFPPNINGKKLDVYHSPYIQNCTNQSGPWLIDGTLFVPNQTVQIPTAVGTTSFEANTTTITVTVSDGAIKIGDSINSGPQHPGFFNARTLLLANKAFIKDQVITFINNKVTQANETFATGSPYYNFVYEQSKCSRDVGLIIENIAYDATFGGNEKSVESGKSYYNGVINLIEGQQFQTTEAINYINDLAQLVIRNELATVLSSATSQVINIALTDGGIAGNEIASGISIITSIINSGTSVAPTVFNSCGPETPGVSAEILLQANRTFLQEEITAYVDAQYPNFTYKKDYCYRDVGLIIDAVSQDIVVGGNTKSIEAALSYFTGSKGDSSVAEQAIINNLTLIKDIILNGSATAPEPVSGPNLGTGYSNAADLITRNRLFLQTELSAYVRTIITLTAQQQALCFRDIGLITDAIAEDIGAGGNANSVYAALQYFSGAISILPSGEVPALADALVYMTELCRNIVKNKQNTNLYQTYIPQVITLAPATPAEYDQVAANVDLITDIITLGPDAAPTPYTPISLDLTTNLSKINAFNILTANKDFLAAEVSGFVDDVFANGFEYNPYKCYRDTGLIVDSLAFDLLYQGNTQAIFAGLQYYNQGGYTGEIGREITTTTQAINYAKDLAKQVALNIPVDFIQSASTQTFDLVNYSSEATTATVEVLFNTVTNILINGTAGITNQIIPNGGITNDSDVINGAALIQTNKQFIEDEVIAYVDNELANGFIYDKVKCARDTGLIVKALAQDLLFNGTSQSTFAGIQYWAQSGYTGAIESELSTTTNAIRYVRDLAIKVIAKDTSGTRYQTAVSQYTTGTAATLAEAEVLYENFNLILDIITNGTDSVTDRIVSNRLTVSTDQNVVHAYELLIANKDYIKTEAIAYVEAIKSYGFMYNMSTCARDVGYMIDSIAFDLLYGGNRQAIQSGVYYYGYSTTETQIPNELEQTTAAYNRIKTLASYIIAGKRVPSQYQYEVQQVISANTGTSYQAAITSNNIDTILNIITNGPSVASSPSPISLTATTDVAFVNAATALDTNIEFIKAEVIAFIDTTYPVPFIYDRVKCRRDIGYILDCVSFDLLHGGNRQSVQAGVYYYGHNATSSVLTYEVTQAIAAYNHIKNISGDIIKNNTITPTTGNTATQVILPLTAGQPEIDFIAADVNIITDIINNGPDAAYPRTPISLSASTSTFVINAYTALLANREFIQNEVIAYIDHYFKQPFVFNKVKCERDTRIIVDSLALDLIYEGNTQSTFAGLQYWSQGTTAIPGEVTETIAAIDHTKSLVQAVITTPAESIQIGEYFDIITTIIDAGTEGITDQIVPNSLPKTQTSVVAAYENIIAAKTSIQDAVVAWVSSTYPGLVYNAATCYRDVGYIIDCVAFDLLHSGNRQSIQAGAYYFGAGATSTLIDTVSHVPETPQSVAAYNYLKYMIKQLLVNTPVTRSYQLVYPQVIEPNYAGMATVIPGEEIITVDAINYLDNLSQYIISNTDVPIKRTSASQKKYPEFENGEYAGPAVTRNYGIISNIIANGPDAAPVSYVGSGFFATTGVSSNDVRESPTVLAITTVTSGTYLVKLSGPTIGAVANGTLYFGETLVFPKQDALVPDKWAQRRVDVTGSMGGSLVDGKVVSDRSPIQSFVYDAFTQVNQGGVGIHVTNNGYAQLVSVFTIFCSTAVIVENGGICSITNSNSNFGDQCLVAKGYGKREFSGTVYNPPYPNYQPNGEYYPNGFYPKNGVVEIYLPDTQYRPHIALVMEVEPPLGHINEQGLGGFLNAAPTLATLTTGTITINGIDTTGIAVGNTLYIRDQYGNTTYAAEGTVVVDVNYQSVTLSKGLISGGGDPTNSNYFNLYFCGNAFYTVLSSTLTDSHGLVGDRLIPTEQLTPELDAITYMKSALDSLLNLAVVDPAAILFVNDHLDLTASIISAVDLTTAESIEPNPSLTGTPPVGASPAITTIRDNVETIVTNTISYINGLHPALTYNVDKCKRDIRLLLVQLIYDLESGGNYHSVYSGLSYWIRYGTHHVVNLEEAVNNTALFPDGATVNFYQRSYMSASGYLFEYVGAGTNYGALPQRGVADPVQSKEVVQLNNGKVFFTSTDQNGDFRIGPGLVVSQATGVLSGRTFTKSLFANLTPFILAIEGGG